MADGKYVPAIHLALLYDDEQRVGPNMLMSLLSTLPAALTKAQIVSYHLTLCKGYGLSSARNDATRVFLDEHDAEWMMFIDLDMGWERDALDKLLEVADPDTCPIVGGLAFSFGPVDGGFGEANGAFRQAAPTIYDLNETDDDVGFRSRVNYRPNALEKCFATGTAFLLIHRSALEKIREREGDVWFSQIKHPKAKKAWSDDLSFCVRAQLAKVPIHVHTGVRTSHWKPVYVSESFFFSQFEAPPADQEVDVIVPVLKRAEHAEPFMRSLRASTGLARVFAMVNSDEDREVIDAWASAGALVVTCQPGRTTWAHKCNDGYRKSSAPWMLFVGSDVRFHPGWWDHALSSALTHGCSVVATNDLLNGNVRNGMLATHAVMERRYVDELGASWDGPGVVCHEGYKHGGDMEWSRIAVMRGTMVFSPGAVVEHRHFFNGTAEMDDVYRLGQKFVGHDTRLYEERLRRFEKAAA